MEGLERMKEGPEYEVKCSEGDAGSGSAVAYGVEVSSRNSMEETEHVSVMEGPDVLSHVV